MGSPDTLQIDGMGGADPLTSKVAVISRSTRQGVDVDYLFLQVFVDKPIVTDAQNCGNILAGVGPFAIERGLVAATGAETAVTIYMVNTGQIAVARVQTPDGRPTYAGEARIDGAPGTAAPIPIEFRDTAGSSCGALLPTGRAVDVIDGVEATLIDNGMPVVVLQRARSRRHRRRKPRGTGRQRAAQGAARIDPAEGRPDDEPRRRRGEIGAENVAGRGAEGGRRDSHAHLHPPPLPRLDRRARRGVRRHRLPGAGLAGREPRRPARRRAQDASRSSIRPAK